MSAQYLSKLCRPVTVITGRQRLHSVRHGHLDVPWFWLTIHEGQSFGCAAAATV